MKKIKYKAFSFTDKDKNINDGVKSLIDSMNEWYKSNQDVQIISANVDTEQMSPRIKGHYFYAIICYIEETKD